MCLYHYDTGVSVNECYMNAEQCGIRSFRKNGSLGTDDSAMYYIKIFRAASSAATCTPYTVYMSNG